MKYFDGELLSGYNMPMFWQRARGMGLVKVAPSEKCLIDLGRNTTKAEYQVRADTVQKWWGLWGLCAFKTGYEQRGKNEH